MTESDATVVPDGLVGEALVTAFGESRVGHRVTLAPLTTFRTGGEADWFVETRSSAEIIRAVGLGADLGLQVTLLGGGSNVLVGERGVRGLVLRIWHGTIALAQPGTVRVHGGVTLNGLVRWTVNRGWAGLERWAGTPGTVGGGLHGNAHFHGELLGSHLLRAGVVDRQGSEHTVNGKEMEFGYGASRLQRTGEAVVWAEFGVTEAEPAALRARARESLTYRKRTQPLATPSAGCIFRNPDPVVDRIPDGLPSSAGALVDRASLKGRSVGRAAVSSVHGNFIVSNGHAAPSDIRRLVELCRAEVHDHFGIVLRDEIVYLGEFDT